MKKVITYGTYDLLHFGHIRLLERAKSLGDYLIVGVTSDDFDKTRGKINVQQSLMERVEAVRATGLADEIIIEEYEGQKIDDIRKYDVDIFTVGSDWVGYFDYLNEYCTVVYLERTQGVSSTELRAKKRNLRLGVLGAPHMVAKIVRECEFVNGLEISGVYTDGTTPFPDLETENYEELLNRVDAVYLVTSPQYHYLQIKQALEKGIHVLCESPMTLNIAETDELRALAEKKSCVLMDAIKTAYSTAYSRLVLLAKSGKIGQIISVDATATSLKDAAELDFEKSWNSINGWGPTNLLPVFQILGTDYKNKQIISKVIDEENHFDAFTKISFIFDKAVASIKVGKGYKSEGELVVTGSKGCIYVPAPWWKTDYFEIRYENPADNKRFFFQLEGEGIRYELVAFLKTIETRKDMGYIEKDISDAIIDIIGDFYRRNDVIELH